MKQQPVHLLRLIRSLQQQTAAVGTLLDRIDTVGVLAPEVQLDTLRKMVADLHEHARKARDDIFYPMEPDEEDDEEG